MVYQLYPALLLLFVLSKPWHGVYGLDSKTASAFASSSFEYFVNICSLLTRLFPVLQGTHTVYLFKKSAEIIGIAKAKLVGYFLDTFWRFGEHCLCNFVFVSVDVSFV